MERFYESVAYVSKYFGVEGFFVPEQSKQLTEFLQEHPEIKTICEIGFNVGMSSAMCLNARPDTCVVSFDIGHHSYVKDQKQLMDELFPNRHVLYIGDSRQSLPAFAATHTEPIFDFCIVDGGHQEDIPYKDICNSLAVLKPNGWILIDDVWDTNWEVDVGIAARRAITEGLIVEVQQFTCPTRGWILARKPMGPPQTQT